MTNKINKALILGKINGATKLLKEYYSESHRAEWDKVRMAEYEALYPTFVPMSYTEYVDSQDDTVILMTEDEYKDGDPYTRLVDYSDNEEWVSYDDWLNETKAVEEATETTPEVTELVRQYKSIGDGELDSLVAGYEPLQTKKKELAATKYKEQTEAMIAEYDQYERDTFIVQELEAKLYKADNTAEVPMITAIANARGIEIDALADKILVKSALFKQAIGSIMGAKQKELG